MPVFFEFGQSRCRGMASPQGTKNPEPDTPGIWLEQGGLLHQKDTTAGSEQPNTHKAEEGPWTTISNR